MRIAFASCMFNRVFSDQPVWSWIAEQVPDALVLLGDSTYFDVDSIPHPQAMDDFAFAQHLFQRYGELMAQPQFAALVGGMPEGTVSAIWDDHDFLWNDALGAEVHPVHTEKVRISTAFHEAFRKALRQRLVPGSFPPTHNDRAFWDLAQPHLSTPSIALSPEVRLHLSDGRTHRTRTFLLSEAKRTLLGKAQKERFTLAIESAPLAVHLWASGSTVAGYQRYTRDLEWLMRLAAGQRMLVLSGDIHRNQLDAFHTGRLPLHEATSSGAAVRDAVIAGAGRQNHGILDIDEDLVTIRLFKRNRLELRRVLNMDTWLPVS
jgi:alkaline phosphatase D